MIRSWKHWFGEKDQEKQTDLKKDGENNEIAIVGMACRFPGANNYQQYWANLKAGVNSIREITPDRWDLEQFYSPERSAPNKSVSKWGGLLDSISHFDTSFFNISPREAEMMDPQQRLLLEETWHCIEDAAIPLSTLQAGNTSVYVGVMAIDYHQCLIDPDCDVNGYSCLGNYQGILANRLSYFLNLTGESQSIDAACASSLVSIHDAKQSILSGVSEYAIAAGVSVICHPWKYISFSKAHMLSPDGQCKTFDAAANGYVPGEGVGVLLLERLDKAIAQGHRIYGIIKGTAVHHSGKTKSITAPRIEAQRGVVEDALRESDFSAETLSYLEAHGTGTSLGDPIEVEALTQAFNTEKRQYCYLGSVKTNIGHLEAAAGVASVIKVLMMMQHKQIAPTLNIKTVNPIIDFANSPFRLADKLTEWNVSEEMGIRRAGISSFGFGGVDAHLIVEEYIPAQARTKKADSVLVNPIPFVLSTKSAVSMQQLLQRWQEFIKTPEFSESSIENIVQILSHSRQAFNFRFSCAVQSKRELVKLLSVINTQTLEFSDTTTELKKKAMVLRIQPPSELDYTEFIKLCQQYPILTRLAEEVYQVISTLRRGREIIAQLNAPKDPKGLILQQFIATYLLSKSLLESGLKPQCLIGQGFGELVDIVLNGMLNIADAIQWILGFAEKIQLHQPQLRFYERRQHKSFEPYEVSRSYCSFLVKQLEVDKLSSLAILEKSRQLELNQFTFKKYLADWDKVFARHHISLDLSAKKYKKLKTKQQVFLIIVLLYSIKKLSTKWELTEHIDLQNDAVNELVDLLLDGVIGHDDLASLFFEKNKLILDSLFMSIKKNNYKIDSTKPYKILSEYSQSIFEINDPNEWLRAITDPNESLKHSREHLPESVDSLPADIKSPFYIDIGRSFKEDQESHLFLALDDLAETLPDFLLQLWQRGVTLDWHQWYRFDKSVINSLPNYPFLQESYWFERISPVKPIKPLPQTETSPGSLVTTLPSYQIINDKTCSLPGNEFYFTDHLLNDESILPAAVSLELVRFLGRSPNSYPVLGLTNIIWIRPIKLLSSSIELSVVLNGEVFSIVSQQSDIEKKPLIHSEGRLDFSRPSDIPPAFDLRRVNERCTRKMTDDEVYLHFKRLGLNYGPCFHLIHNFVFNRKEGLTQIQVVRKADQFEINLSLFDAAFQSALLLLEDKNTLYLPFSLEQLTLFEFELPADCFVYVRLVEGSEQHGLPKFNIDLIDSVGRVLVSFRNFTVRAMVNSVTDEKPGLYYYHPTLIEERLQVEPLSRATLLVFDDSGSLVHALNEQHPENQIIHVSQSEHFNIIGKQNYQLNRLNRDDYLQLVAQLLENDLIPNQIIYRGKSLCSEEISLALLNEQLNDSFYSLLYLVSALMEKKNNKPIVINYLYEVNVEQDLLFENALMGFARTLNLERPELQLRFIRLAKAETQVYQLLKEMTVRDIEVHYDANLKRKIKRYIEFKPHLDSVSVYRKGGVYLITGGVRGLGYILATHLAKNYQAKLLLVGRSASNDTITNRMAALEDLGAEVVYVHLKFHLSNMQEIWQEDINKGIEKLGSLNGVFHAGGVLNDSFILNKTAGDAAEVFAPKIFGTYNLDLATKNQPLDFFVMFSSMVAIFGNVGQCDYAYANGFMDSFAEYRDRFQLQNKRRGQTVSINWPLWIDGGMQMDQAYQAAIIKRIGLTSLAVDDGLRAMELAILQHVSQVLVLPGYKNKIEQSLLDAMVNPKHEMDKTSPLIKNVDNSILHEKTEYFLNDLISTALKLPPGKLVAEDSFDTYGIDSFMIMSLNSLLEEYFGELPKTLFFEYLTLKELISYFIENHRDTLVNIIVKESRDARNLFSVQLSEQPFLKTDPLKESLFSAALEQKVVTSSDSSKIRRENQASNSPQNQFVERRAPKSIAIIGISGRYPQARNLDDFWENLRSGKDSVTEIPATRWDYHRYYDPDKEKEGRSYSKWGAFIDDFDKFDPLFFNITPLEAQLMDPQERLFLETTWNTLEDAGYTKDSLKDKQVGVYVGVMYEEYQLFGAEESLKGNFIAPNPLAAYIANRISYYFNFHGPSISLDTMCSSSLTAIHLACRSLSSGECQVAIAGGVNLSIHPDKYLFLSRGKFLASDGRCHSFGEGGDGYVPGEGVGAVLLKPLSQALADGDHVYGVIKGTSINHGGKTNGFTVPSPTAQATLIETALKNAVIDSHTISYVEAHGTGTSLGDPIEMTGLTKVFGQERQDLTIALGSVKSNIGHLESAAGIAALTKVLLQMKHHLLVPSLHSTTLNPNIDWSKTPFKVQQSLDEWKRPVFNENGQRIEYPRRAGISSFGAGGSNAHIIIEEPPELFAYPIENKPYYLIVLSAKTPAELQQKMADLSNWLVKHQDEEFINTKLLEEISFTLNHGRTHFDNRAALVCQSIQELQNGLHALMAGRLVTNAWIYYPDSLEEVDLVNLNDSMKLITENLEEVLLTSTEMYFERLSSLANCYVRGCNLDWLTLHADETHRRISLPTYPFAGERYWIDVSTAAVAVLDKSDIAELTISEDKLLLGPIPEPEHSPLPQDLFALTCDFLKGLVAAETKIPPDKIKLKAGFDVFGMDSIMISRLNKTLESYFDKLPATLFFKYQNLQQLAGYFIENHQDKLLGLIKPKVSQSGAADDLTLARKTNLTPLAESEASTDQDGAIAIVGLSGQFPLADNLVEYWDNLKTGRNCIIETPQNRWNNQQYSEQLSNKLDVTPGKIYCNWGGFIADYDKFDAGFFNISPRDAMYMDPQERLFLQCVWSCIESAGYTPESLNRSVEGDLEAARVGVFVGVSFNNYPLVCAEAVQDEGLAAVINAQTFSAANRVSYFFNFTGPSIPVDTACSSSLYALHLACESIHRGECSVAIVGGSNLTVHPSKYATLCAGGYLASDGLCHSFGAGGDGYVPGEGVGAVLLKPLAKALADKDHIYGVIKGSAVSHDGKTHGYTVPNPVAQSAAIKIALKKANIDPRTISYVEAHGTGTTLGDPIEITGLTDVYEKFSNDKQYCAIGSVKSNIGHLEASAGISQLIKVLLQMNNKMLVPSLLHSAAANPSIDFANSPFHVQLQLKDWQQPIINGESTSRRAGVSSFGAGGTNVHVVLEEYQSLRSLQDSNTPYTAVIPLSAKTEDDLRSKVAKLRAFLQSHTNPITGRPLQLLDLAYTLQLGRVGFASRLAFVANSLDDLRSKLDVIINAASLAELEGIYFAKVVLENDMDMDPLLESNLNKLAQSWVAGASVKWENNYLNSNPERIYLPTYEFKKARHWPEKAIRSKGTGIDDAKVNNKVAVPRIETGPKALNRAPPVNPDITHAKQPKNKAFLLTIAELPEQEQYLAMVTYCQEKVAKVLGFAEELPEPDKGFFELGMESILAVKIQRDFETDLGINIPDTAIFEYPTISKMAGFFLQSINFAELEDEPIRVEKLDEPPLTQNADPSSLGPNSLPKDIEAMTAEEAIKSLQSLLGDSEEES